MRPTYENSSDIANEERVAQELTELWGLDKWHRNPPKYPIDISFIKDGRIIGFAEIKCRAVTRNQYDTYMISVGKVMSAHSLTKATSLPCLLVVRWSDSIGWIDLAMTEPKYVGWGGRVDRKDSQDMEPVMHYDISEFKRVES
jgi:hypothetical protein